jgi:hypothetical protein
MTARELFIKLQGDCLSPLESLLKEAGKEQIKTNKRKVKQ